MGGEAIPTKHITPLSPWRGVGGEAILTKHITPLSPWRGVGGEALLSSLFVEGLGVRPVVVGVRLFK